MIFICIFASLKRYVMQFKDIVGQRDVINRLTEIIDGGRVSHAQLVLGAAEDGGLQLALAYLQYLCCEHRQHNSGDWRVENGALRADSCGECPSCKKIASLMHPDLHLFFPTATTARVTSTPRCEDFAADFREFVLAKQAKGSLDDWYGWLGIDNKQGMIREADASAIVQALGMKAYEGGWKMVLIWMPEKMNSVAANELLKTLEEPSEHSIILLVGESDERLLSTIRSRVQTIRLASDGRVHRSAEEVEQFGPMLVEWLRLLFKLKMKDLSAQVDKMAQMGREQQKQFLAYTLDVMRDCFLKTAAGLPCNIGSGDAKFDTSFPAMITTNNIEMIDAAINDAIFAIERNAYGKIALMELSFRISKALKKR